MVSAFSRQEIEKRNDCLTKLITNLFVPSDANDATSKSTSGIAGGGALGITTSSEIIGSFVNHQTASDDGVLSLQRNDVVGESEFGNTLSIGVNVAEVAQMAPVSTSAAVRLVRRIVVSGSTCTAVGLVAALVNVHSVLSGRQTVNSTGNSHLNSINIVNIY